MLLLMSRRSRAARIALNAVTALSVLLFAATVVLWVRSYFVADAYAVDRGGESAFFWSSRGGVELLHVSSSLDHYGISRVGSDIVELLYGRQSDDPGVIADRGVLGFRYRVSLGGRVPGGLPYMTWSFPRSWKVRVPLWSLAVLTAALPAERLWRHGSRRRAIRRGLCPHCRYNLTGNVSGVCPECGTPAVVNAACG